MRLDTQPKLSAGMAVLGTCPPSQSQRDTKDTPQLVLHVPLLLPRAPKGTVLLWVFADLLCLAQHFWELP